MTDATTLRTYIQTVEPSTRLIQLTNFGGTGGTLDTDVLDAFCQEAIDWFTATVTTYDATNHSLHKQIARHRVMQLLYGRTDDLDKASEYESNYRELIPGTMRRRTLSPVTNSPYTHYDVSDETDGTNYSPWSRQYGKGYRPTDPGQAIDPEDLTS